MARRLRGHVRLHVHRLLSRQHAHAEMVTRCVVRQRHLVHEAHVAGVGELQRREEHAAHLLRRHARYHTLEFHQVGRRRGRRLVAVVVHAFVVARQQFVDVPFLALVLTIAGDVVLQRVHHLVAVLVDVERRAQLFRGQDGLHARLPVHDAACDARLFLEPVCRTHESRLQSLPRPPTHIGLA